MGDAFAGCISEVHSKTLWASLPSHLVVLKFCIWAWPILAVSSSASYLAGLGLHAPCPVLWTELAGGVFAEAAVLQGLSCLLPPRGGRGHARGQRDAGEVSGAVVSGQVLCHVPIILLPQTRHVALGRGPSFHPSSRRSCSIAWAVDEARPRGSRPLV